MMDNKGQSTIEFLSSIFLVLSFFLVFIKVAFNATEGFYIHYATYMASRTFLVADKNSNTPDGNNEAAIKKGREVFKKLKVGAFGYNEANLKFNTPGSVYYNYVGAWYPFEQSFTVTKLFGGTEKMKLRSESFLGREPDQGSCLNNIDNAMSETASDSGYSERRFRTYYDNGC